MLNDNLVRLTCGEDKVAIAFSGGTDSSCLLFSLLELGFRPTLYTYVVTGYASNDLVRAQMVSKAFNLSLVISVIPDNIDSLVSDVRRIVSDGIRGKVNIQCMHGHYYVAQNVKERLIFNGSGIDGLYGAYRTFAYDGSHKDKVVFDRVRRRKHLDNPNDDAMEYQRDCYAKFDVNVIYPYRQGNIIDFLMGLSWPQINKPSMKWIAVRDYQLEFGGLKGYYRPRGSQQIEAGIRTLHNRLLRTPLNAMGRRRVDEIYKDIAAGRV